MSGAGGKAADAHPEQQSAAADVHLQEPVAEQPQGAAANVDAAASAFDALVMLTFTPSCSADSEELEDIVEFSWSVVTVASLEVSAPTQLWIGSATVSDERVARLGLDKDELAQGVSLREALDQFKSALQKRFAGRSFCLVVATAWDIKSCLFANASLSSIKLPSLFHTFFDLSVEFQRQYTDAPPAATINEMCTYLQLAETGEPTRCADAVADMASIVKRMIMDGHAFAVPETLPAAFDPFAPSASPPSTAAPASSAPAVAAAPSAAAAPASRFVWTRGLPWQATAADLKAFFVGLEVDQVLFNMGPQGRPNGEAYIAFKSAEDADIAQAKFNRQMLGHRYIEVFASTEADFELATRRQNQMSQGRPGFSGSVEGSAVSRVGPGAALVKMRGLPYSVRDSDVIDYLQGVRIAPNGIHILRYPDGRITGEAFVELLSEDQMPGALAKHKGMMGTRYIEIFRATVDDLRFAESRAAMGGFKRAGQHDGGRWYDQHGGGDYDRRRDFGAPYGGGGHGHGHGGGYGAPPMHGYGAPPGGGAYGAPPAPAAPAPSPADMYGDVFVRLRGLPFSCNEHDIMQFFAPAMLSPIGIQIMQNAQNRPSGEAFVQFATPDEARRALTRHRGYMGQRYIEVFHAAPQEVMAVVGAAAGGGAPPAAAVPHYPSAAAPAPAAPYGQPAYAGAPAPYGAPLAPAYGAPPAPAYGAPAAAAAGYGHGQQRFGQPPGAYGQPPAPAYGQVAYGVGQHGAPARPYGQPVAGGNAYGAPYGGGAGGAYDDGRYAKRSRYG